MRELKFVDGSGTTRRLYFERDWQARTYIKRKKMKKENYALTTYESEYDDVYALLPVEAKLREVS